MDKPVVLFPFVEAGMGHSAPMRAIADKFKELYGDVVDCRETNFYADSGNDVLIEFEKRMCDSVIKSNRNALLGFFITFNMNLWGAGISNAASATFLKRGTVKPAIERVKALAPDLVVSTHWSTNYFAKKCENAPLTVLYCPDARLYPMFNYPCDMALVPTEAGYKEALKKYRRRYTADNLKCVPTLIRGEAFNIDRTKREAKLALGLDPDKFTVLLAEGGYGIGKMEKICREVMRRDLNVTVIPVCGKNSRLFEKMQGWKIGARCSFVPVGYTDRMLEYMSAADLFCGKSGANVFAEATYFGVPQIVTKYASGIEKLNGHYYVKNIKTALKIFNAVKVADKIEEFLNQPERLAPLKAAAEAQKENFGAQKTADIIFRLLLTKFPHLAEQRERLGKSPVAESL